MEILMEQVRINQMGKEITNQFVIEEDFNVPDNKEDIGRIITGEGRIRIEEIKHMESYLKMCGKLHFKILYVTDTAIPTLASMEGQIPVEELVYVESEENEEYQLKINRIHFRATMIHSRKVEVKAITELSLHWENTCSEEISIGVEAETPQVYQKKKVAEIMELHDKKKDIYRIREEVSLPGTKENIEKIIWEEVSLRKLETKLSEEKLILNGELQVFCIYQAGDEKMDWIEQMVPFEGQLEFHGADSDFYHHVSRNLAEVHLEVKMDEDGEMRIIGVEAVLELRVLIYKERKLELLEDAYSLQMECEAKKRHIFLEELLMQSHSRCKIVEKVQIPEIREEILQICHTSGELQVEKTEVTPAGIYVEGILHINFLYVKANDQIPFDVWSGMVPFSYLIECDQAKLDIGYDITTGIEQLNIELVGSGEVEVKAYLAFHSLLRNPLNIETISEIQYRPFEEKAWTKKPGIIGYMVRTEDDLWTLAKKYGTTEESIIEINSLSSKCLKEGEKILILKENVSIL